MNLDEQTCVHISPREVMEQLLLSTDTVKSVWLYICWNCLYSNLWDRKQFLISLVYIEALSLYLRVEGVQELGTSWTGSTCLPECSPWVEDGKSSIWRSVWDYLFRCMCICIYMFITLYITNHSERNTVEQFMVMKKALSPSRQFFFF